MRVGQSLGDTQRIAGIVYGPMLASVTCLVHSLEEHGHLQRTKLRGQGDRTEVGAPDLSRHSHPSRRCEQSQRRGGDKSPAEED